MKIKIIAAGFFTLAAIALFSALLLAEPARYAYAKAISPPGCQCTPYGCSLPPGFRGWPQFP